MTPSPPARRVEVAVDRPANGGEAVGRADGRVLFVRGAIPGERVIAEITDDRHDSYWRAEAVEILDPSPYRIPVACPAAAGGAGCCDLGHIEPGHARDLKQAVLLDVLSRVGHLDEATIADTDLATRGVDRLPGTDTGWRIRTRLAVDGRGRAGQRAFRGSAVIHDVCVQPAAGMVDDLAGRRFTPHAELAVVLDADGTRHITELAPIAEVRHGDPRRRAQQNRRRRSRPRAQVVVEGAEFAVHRVGGRSWNIPVTGFWQAHRAAPQTYADTVVGFVGEHLDSGPRVAWDLYGGAGVFAGALLDTYDTGLDEVHIVDSDAGALAAASETFADDGDRVVTHRGEVAVRIHALGEAPDIVVLDPPRTGAGERVVDAITAARPAVVVHVGCDAARFARDLGLFVRSGYRVAQVRGFDAFPLTHHVEAVACLVPA
ncbi:class I SAM-dependent RNA methyltransferase [Gordonia amicalis]|uniref:Class I SAM-dependent RNA methyltransferase n=1 Tax=Gordonia amicalis TaxID=89053 RepID=A0AAE4U3V8_9ACTN|nr:TRAM domain-containing protein [Gordonia amicalis]MCZ4577736.1 class I SAM-dependent RNA methyltransferase [Gordonia amicalis]MDV6310560.1 class I SAM-dependent RNA methyltransferase [Gordonia amicalis]MDV7098713.1 class I SAM-dependent RNA methyltransferase [Gordonia amicalis]UKO90652.1 class I SAM-dependent RNA methyltransferase [Gordonia amicalis]